MWGQGMARLGRRRFQTSFKMTVFVSGVDSVDQPGAGVFHLAVYQQNRLLGIKLCSSNG